jgi:hypothetical protein
MAHGHHHSNHRARQALGNDGSTAAATTDNLHARGAEPLSEAPSAAIPIPRGSDGEDDDGDEDVERGADLLLSSSSAPLDEATSGPRRAWRNLTTTLSISALSGDTAVWRQSPADRNR